MEEENVIFLQSRKGRGTQYDVGARMASSEYLIFIHADTRIPLDSSTRLFEFFLDEERKIGAFTIKFKPSSFILNLITIASRIDSVLTSFGDQCIFMRKEFYED